MPDFININGLITLSHEDKGNHYIVQVKGTTETYYRRKRWLGYEN
jgi:hypothetical protein